MRQGPFGLGQAALASRKLGFPLLKGPCESFEVTTFFLCFSNLRDLLADFGTADEHWTWVGMTADDGRMFLVVSWTLGLS